MVFFLKRRDTNIFWTHITIATDAINIIESVFWCLGFLDFWLVFMVFHGLLHSDAIFLRFTDHRMQSFPMGANHRFSDAMFAMYSASPDLHLNIFHMNKVRDVLVFGSHIVLVMTSSKSITANSDFFRSDVGLIAFFSHCQDCRLIAGNLFAASILIGSSRPSWDAHSLFLSFSSSPGTCFPT